ncbi:MAG: dihydrolipoamide acetyltransferase family protein [Actinomycetota bacterium]|jgi:pyruvate dehydrogenase E2 component (dihydrolipoamide acetyltransferase)|nr:dihydrolipoamide acetyltransferase family protein [Actinomycetota bacterium]
MSTFEFRLPDVGEGLEEAEIIEWLVAPGDTIRRDQPLLEILTDKSQTELPAPTAGVVAALHPQVGDIAKVGDLLIEIAVDGRDLPDEGPAPTTAEATSRPAAPAPKPAASSQGRRAKAAPAVRRRAREAGIDLQSLAGSGPGGRITDEDLQRAKAAPLGQAAPSVAAISTTAAPPTSSVGQMPIGQHPLRGVRRVTAKAMGTAWQVPHIHGMDEVDATNLLSGRARIKELIGPSAARLTPLPFLVTAVARALRRYPVMNASIDVEAEIITVHQQVNIGIAVATDDGLIVPVITDADQRGLIDLVDEIARLSSAARDRSITAADLRGGTCTISNYGSLGGRFSTPIIRAPEAAIVGFGAIRPRPFVIDGQVVARPTLPVVTGADHRLIDGDSLTAFQEHIVGLIADPVALMVA